MRTSRREFPGGRPLLALAATLMSVLAAGPARAAPPAAGGPAADGPVADGPVPGPMEATATAPSAAVEEPATQRRRDAGPRYAVGALGGAATGQADGLESGHGFGGSFRAFFHRHLGVEVGYRRHGFDVLETEENELSGGDMDTDLVTAGVVVRVPGDSRATPWVAGGVAWFRNRFDIDPSVRRPLEEFDLVPREEVEDVVGLQVGGGVDVRVASSVAVFGEARFVSGSADTGATLTDRISGVSSTRAGSQDVRALIVSGGVRFVF